MLAQLDQRAAAVADADSDSARVAAVLGDAFRLLPKVVMGAELAGTFATDLQAGDPLAAVTWLQRAAHVREGASRLEGTLLYAEATGSPQALKLRVGQLPAKSGDRWVGLPGPIGGGRLSLVVQSAAASAPAAGAKVAGLVVDEWTEVIPDASLLTGVSFHVEQPAARAPQAILLAVAPDESHVWSLSTLEATLNETFDLARVRLVDSEALGPAGGLGQYLPAVYLPAAPPTTVTSDLAVVTG